MSAAFEAQKQARRDAAVRAELEKINIQKEAEVMAGKNVPMDLENRIKQWVKDEVALSMQAMAQKMRQTLQREMTQQVKDQVSNYCKSVFDTQQEDHEYAHIERGVISVIDESRPNSPTMMV